MFAGLSVKADDEAAAPIPSELSAGGGGGGMFAGLDIKAEEAAPAGMFAGLSMAPEEAPPASGGGMFAGLSVAGDRGMSMSIGGSQVTKTMNHSQCFLECPQCI